MRKSILTTIAIVICLSLQAQDYKAAVKTQFLEYTNLLIKKDFAKSVNYVNPALFKIIPKEKFIEAMEMAFNSPDMDMLIDKVDIVSLSDKQTISGMQYVKIKYVNYVRLKFKLGEGEEIDSAAAKQGLEEEFGKGNVAYDARTKYFKITMNENVIANSADEKKWTFVVADPKRKPMLEKFLPKEIL
jgi:hypothetical protein